MENTLVIDHHNGHKTEYELMPDGNNLPIAYYKGLPPKLIQALEYARINKIRVRLDLGDPKTGKSWNEIYDVTGYVGLSRGSKARFPILIHNARSMGGGQIMQDCILSIHRTKKGNVYTSMCLYDCRVK